MSVFLALLFVFLYRNLFSTISATLQKINDLRILTDWKRKKSDNKREKKEGKKEKGKGKHFTVILYFSKIYRTSSPSCCRGIPSVSHPPPIPKPSNIRGDFLPQAAECYFSSKSNIQNFPTTIVFSGNSR